MKRLQESEAKLLVFSFAIVFSCLFLANLSYPMEDPGLPDTVLFDEVSYYLDESLHEVKLRVPVVFFNDEDLMTITVPFVWSGPVSLDSGSFTGSRVEAIETSKGITIDNENQKVVLWVVIQIGDAVEPGRGLLGTLHFSILQTGYLDIDTTAFPPGNFLAFSGYEAMSWTPQFSKLHFHLQDIVYFEPVPGSRVSADGDTFYIQPEGEDAKVNFNLKNQSPINAFGAALIDRCYDGDIFLDPQKNNNSPLPQCFIGGRTVLAGWETHILNLTLYPSQFMLTGLLMLAPSLPPGDGPLATLTFTATDTGCICLDTLFFPTGETIFLVDSNSVGYTPEFISRTFYVRNCPYNPGDLNWDENVDVNDVMLLIDYLFRAGKMPCPLKSADVNCDQKVSISDAVYLISYLFRNGPPPQTCEY